MKEQYEMPVLTEHEQSIAKMDALVILENTTPGSGAHNVALIALAALVAEHYERVNADQMHRVCLEAERSLNRYEAMAKEVNKLLGRLPKPSAPPALKPLMTIRPFGDVDQKTYVECDPEHPFAKQVYEVKE